MNQRILVVDDDKKTVDLIRLYLERDDYQVVAAYDGVTALEMAQIKQPDLIILDLMLPGLDGLEVCRLLRAQSDVPIIMLTAKSTEPDKLRGLGLGADDYIVKPFSPLELLARMKAVLRRANAARRAPITHIHIGALWVDVARHVAEVNGEPVHLTPKEFRLLEIMALEPGRVFSRTELLEMAFGFDYDGLERTVDVHIMNLRRKIEPDPASPIYIQTVYGVGYRLANG